MHRRCEWARRTEARLQKTRPFALQVEDHLRKSAEAHLEAFAGRVQFLTKFADMFRRRRRNAFKDFGKTAQVPDFAARHERIKRQWLSRTDSEEGGLFKRSVSLNGILLRLERRKYQNRTVTQPEPFVFNTPSRSQTRQPPMPKVRHLHASSEAAGSSQRLAFPTTKRSLGSLQRGLERGERTAHLRTSSCPQHGKGLCKWIVVKRCKVTSQQQATMRKLQERRLREMQEKMDMQEVSHLRSDFHLLSFEVPNDEMKFRVMQAHFIDLYTESLRSTLRRWGRWSHWIRRSNGSSPTSGAASNAPSVKKLRTLYCHS